MARILLVDDLEGYRQKYGSLTEQLGHEVILATGVKEGIEKIVSEHPDAIVTDKDMPDGSGNAVAKYAKQNVSGIRVLGITGGDKNDFDPSYVDIRMSKSAPDSQYKEALGILLDSARPSEEYAQRFAPSQESTMDLAAFYVLVQGYVIGTQVQNGVQPIPELEIPMPNFDPKYLLDLEDVGLTADSLYSMMCDREQYLRNDAIVSEFMERLGAKEYDKVTLDEAVYVQKALYRLLGGE